MTTRSDLTKFNKDSKQLMQSIEDKADLSSLGKLSIEVGLPSDRIHNPSGLTMAELGARHEFGAKDTPERSFLRSSLVKKENQFKQNLSIISKKAIKGDDPMSLMSMFALVAQGLVQERVVEVNNPPNSPMTIARKGSSNPLIDTGEMRQGIIGVVVSD